jgi:hypothetical protein
MRVECGQRPGAIRSGEVRARQPIAVDHLMLDVDRGVERV